MSLIGLWRLCSTMMGVSPNHATYTSLWNHHDPGINEVQKMKHFAKVFGRHYLHP